MRTKRWKNFDKKKIINDFGCIGDVPCYWGS